MALLVLLSYTSLFKRTKTSPFSLVPIHHSYVIPAGASITALYILQRQYLSSIRAESNEHNRHGINSTGLTLRYCVKYARLLEVLRRNISRRKLINILLFMRSVFKMLPVHSSCSIIIFVIRKLYNTSLIFLFYLLVSLFIFSWKTQNN